MEAWYCQACRNRMHEENLENSEEEESEDLRQLEAEVEAGKLEIEEIEKDIENCSKEFDEE